MPRLKELQEKRNKLMADATVLARKEGITAEERTQVNAMLSDVDILEADIATEERLVKHEEERSKESREHKAPPRGNPGEVENDTPEKREERQREAFEQYVRYGMAGVDQELRSYLRSGGRVERRDLGVGTVGTPAALTGGSQLVPKLYDTDLLQAQKAFGALLGEVSVMRTASGAPMQISTVNDTANGLLEMPEMTATVEVDPALGTATSNTMMLTTGWVKVSVQELQDSAFNIDALISDIFGKRYSRGAVSKITSGSTDGTTIQSIVTGASAGATSTSGTAIGYADFVALYGALDPAYMDNAKWSMNSNTRAKIMGLTDTLGRPLFIPAPNAGTFDTLLGRPVFINQALANIPSNAAANIVPVQFGDFKSAYRYRVVTGDPLSGTTSVGELTLIREEHLFVGTLEVGFLGIVRAGGNVLNPGTPALLNLTLKSS